MAYTHPALVLSPKKILSNLKVVHDGGEGAWSLATMVWDRENAVGIRWNGDESRPRGNPQSRGRPTWFRLPEHVGNLILDHLEELKKKED